MVAVKVVPTLPVASVYELILMGIVAPSIASSAGLDIKYFAVKLVVEFLVTLALLPLTVIAGSEPVLIGSSEVKLIVMLSFTTAKVETGFPENIVTVVNEGDCLSKVTPPSKSFATAMT